MSKKISELTSAVSITGTEEVPIVQSGETKKATVDLLRPPIATEITSSSTNTEVAGAKAVYDNSLETYSTTEQRVGTWIDGKPIYKITYVFTFPLAQTTGEWTTNISGLNIDKLCKVDGATKTVFQQPGDIYWRDMTQVYAYSNTSVSEFGAMFIKNNTLYYRYRGFQLTEGFIHLYYTKTTDTATNSLNTSQLMNTGSLVGIGSTANLDVIDRTEIAEQEGSGNTV